MIGEVANFSERVRKHTMALVDELFTMLLMGSNKILNEHFDFKQNALHRVEQNTTIFLADTTVQLMGTWKIILVPLNNN